MREWQEKQEQEFENSSVFEEDKSEYMAFVPLPDEKVSILSLYHIAF